LHDYIAIEKPALNMEWKGIIAGAIYLACQIIGNPIFQTLLSKFIEVSLETIRIRIREITESLNFSDY
jgi:transcription initiation factor TFIIIB Brf1 subunit/transcription initiation factor TFIIB